MEKIRITKVREVMTPTRGTPGSAGIDFYVPRFSDTFIKKLNGSGYSLQTFGRQKHIIIPPQARVLIPSGIHADVPEGYALIAHNKSGVSSNKGLDVLACVVDEDYQGEIHISLVNTGSISTLIGEEEKLVQFLLIKVPKPEIELVDSLEELYDKTTVRGSGGFGHTGS